MVRDMKNLNLNSRNVLVKTMTPKHCGICFVVAHLSLHSQDWVMAETPAPLRIVTFLCSCELPPNPSQLGLVPPPPCLPPQLVRMNAGSLCEQQGHFTDPALCFLRSLSSPPCLAPCFASQPGLHFPELEAVELRGKCQGPRARPPGSPAQFHTNQ